MNRPIHPALARILGLGLEVAAKATAKAVDSVLKDIGTGLGSAERSVQQRRAEIRRKVRESGIQDDEE